MYGFSDFSIKSRGKHNSEPCCNYFCQWRYVLPGVRLSVY